MESKTLNLSQYWLEKIVIGLDLCPFARIPFEKKLIRLVECRSHQEAEHFQFFFEELELLNETSNTLLSTTILVFPNASNNFHAFNDFAGEIESVLDKENLNSFFQIVVFHPKFIFENTQDEDVENLVNRSPFPAIHILRTEDMNNALKDLEKAKAISLQNESKLKQMSPEKRKELFYYLYG